MKLAVLPRSEAMTGTPHTSGFVDDEGVFFVPEGGTTRSESLENFADLSVGEALHADAGSLTVRVEVGDVVGVLGESP